MTIREFIERHSNATMDMMTPHGYVTITPEIATGLLRGEGFVVSLMTQNLARDLFSVANEHGGKLTNRAVFFCVELGTMPPFDILPLFSAGRPRRLTLVPIIQSLAQLEKNYGKEGGRNHGG